MTIKTSVSNRVLTITLNRPKALNAFNEDMYRAVDEALQSAAADDGISVVVITGEGRAFCAGQDMGEMAGSTERDNESAGAFGPFIDNIASFSKPLIAAINGMGVGIGLTLLPHCDFVYMAKSARLRAPFAALGVTVEAGNSYLLPQLINWYEVADILYTSKWISAEQAVDIGLAFRVSEDDALMTNVMAKADEIAAMPLVSLLTTKKLLQAHRKDKYQQARTMENAAFAELINAPANREAIAAFKEKRAPDFSHLGE